MYRDGGTMEYISAEDDTRYFVDGRINTKTPGKVFDMHPSRSEAIQLPVELDILPGTKPKV